MLFPCLPAAAHFFIFKMQTMNTLSQKPFLRGVAEQVTNNTTGWIGHKPGNNETVIKGQTFIASGEGDLYRIEIFSSFVKEPGKVVLTLHDFDSQQNSWGREIGNASLDFKKTDSGRWMAFDLHGLHLDKGKSYGFLLESNDSCIGVGEAAGSHQQPPLKTGQEWEFINGSKKGDAFSYFSLAFKVAVSD